ncbi:MAG: hypothetical protein IJ846_02930 [Alphaproteobacteria bacterium]|nr:hypothetical protein [Alphaproteobacteria bacterium]
MTEISYERLVEKALLRVVHDALESAEQHGLDGNHFYITFQTNRDDVILSERLKTAYPEEMTIVLQHEYYDLKTEEDKFSVTLSFNNVSERITVPFDAVARFADPYAQFALTFTPEKQTAAPKPKKEKETKNTSENVVSLSAFRKKK